MPRSGLDIAFTRVGSGPALVLLHGYVGDGLSTWHRQVEGLAQDFTVVVWDAPGAGGSSDPAEDLGMAGYADCLAEFLDELGIAQASIGGISAGGAMAIAFAARHPDRTRSLVLLSAYAGWGGSLPAAEGRRRLDQAYALSQLTPQEVVATLLPTMFHAAVPESDASGFADAVAAFHPAGFRALANASAEDLRPLLPTIHVPTLLVYGEDDVRAPRQVAEHLAAAIPGSRLVLIPAVGHAITLEAPEIVNNEIRRFLGELPAEDDATVPGA